MEYENMNRQEEYQSDGDAAMKDQNDGELVQDHSEQAGGEGDHNQCKQQPSFCTQFLSVSNGMDNAQQQKQDRCQLVDMHTGQRHHASNDKTDEKRDIQCFLHTVAGSLAAGMVLTPQIK